jgi:hypothetical protein
MYVNLNIHLLQVTGESEMTRWNTIVIREEDRQTVIFSHDSHFNIFLF